MPVTARRAGSRRPFTPVAGMPDRPQRAAPALPVAIIRPDDTSRCVTGCIAVVVDGSSGNDAVVQQAMEEARLANASLLALVVSHRWSGGIDH